MTDALFAIKKLVYEDKKITMKDLNSALNNNFGKSADSEDVSNMVIKTVNQLKNMGKDISPEDIVRIAAIVTETINKENPNSSKYNQIREMILEIPKFGNDITEVDTFAREVCIYIYKTT